jgi:hypothetical protein
MIRVVFEETKIKALQMLSEAEADTLQQGHGDNV